MSPGIQNVETDFENPSTNQLVVANGAVSGPLAGVRILLAEDAPEVQRFMGHILKKAGAELTIVDNGQLAADAALAAVGDGMPFDVILMDMEMPVLDGYGAATLLRAKGYRLPIIALTAHSMSDDREKCLEAGCDDYATKPVNRAQLIAAIQSQVAQAGEKPPSSSSAQLVAAGDRPRKRTEHYTTRGEE